MILTLISISLLALGIIFLIISNHTYLNDVDFLGLIFTLVGTFATIIFLILIIATHIHAPKAIQTNKLEYEGLKKRYEIIKSDYEDVSRSQVIADITSWNIQVYNTKYWSESPWTNWFNPKDVADNLDYISLIVNPKKDRQHNRQPLKGDTLLQSS